LVAIVFGFPGALWGWLSVNLVRFMFTHFLLAAAIANGITTAAIIVVALTFGGSGGWVIVFFAVPALLASITSGYGWANQYGSGWVAGTGMWGVIVMVLWAIWIWLCALIIAVSTVAAPVVPLWLAISFHTSGSPF